MDAIMSGSGASHAETRSRRIVSRGQALVLFVMSIIAILGFTAIVIDVSSYWATTLRVQRAADAAALAGAVFLPGDASSGVSKAQAEATKNGYTNNGGSGQCGVARTCVVASQDAVNPRQMDVTIAAPVGTFFMRVFGIDTINASRTAKAVYVLPVPMGSPENFYGTYCVTRPGHTSCPANTPIPGAASTTVYSTGFWGAIQATGTDHAQGDAFIPLDDRTRSLGTNPSGGTNPNYAAPTTNNLGPYNYEVELPAGGTLYVFDPTACAVGDQLGTGDHWNDGNPAYSVTTYYNLYDVNNQPYDYAGQTLVASSGDLFAREYQYDQSGTYGTPSYSGDITPTSLDGVEREDCSDGATATAAEGRFWHDKWWPMATVPAGTYRLNIASASLGAPNQAATFENDWSLEAVGNSDASGNKPRVHGFGRMVGYNIIAGSGLQSFYLAQIGREYAGKTIEIDLFDPGDIGGTGTLRIQSPDGDAYNYARFTYRTDGNCGRTRGSTDACSDSTGTRQGITTASGGNSSFNDTWLQILVPLPSTYGQSGLTPPGVPGPGWWKIEYETTSAANDTTTWMVSIRGNPVHLIVP